MPITREKIQKIVSGTIRSHTALQIFSGSKVIY